MFRVIGMWPAGIRVARSLTQIVRFSRIAVGQEPLYVREVRRADGTDRPALGREDRGRAWSSRPVPSRARTVVWATEPASQGRAS